MDRGRGLIPGVASDLAEALKEPHGRVQLVVGHDSCGVHGLGQSYVDTHAREFGRQGGKGRWF